MKIKQVDIETSRKFVVDNYSSSKIEGVEEFYGSLDRYNTETLYNKFFNQFCDTYRVEDEFTDTRKGLRIGWTKDYCLDYYLNERSVIENQYELPTIYEFLSRGCEVIHISQRVGTKNNPSFIEFEGQYNDKVTQSLDAWKEVKHRLESIKDKNLSMKDRFRFIIDHMYIIHGLFPECDIVFLDAFPSFEIRNLWIYCIWYVYGVLRKGRTLLVASDHENRTLGNLSPNGTKSERPFKYSGADSAFTLEEFKAMADSTVWAMYIHEDILDRARELNPDINITTFCLPYDLKLGYHFPKKNPGMEMVYIGNDLDRRNMISKYLCKMNKYVPYIFGGLKKYEDGGYEPKFKDKHKNVNWMGAIPFRKVYTTLNNSYVCLGISSSFNYYIGHNVSRALETPMSGSIVLLPQEYYGAKKYVVYDECIVDNAEDLDDCVEDAVNCSFKTRCEINMRQRINAMKFTSITYGLNNIFFYYDKFKRQ